jgi:hypothetical protein
VRACSPRELHHFLQDWADGAQFDGEIDEGD